MDLLIPKLSPNKIPWRIDWLGDLIYRPTSNQHSQPFIKVSISPLHQHLEFNPAYTEPSNFDHQRQRDVWLPLGLLHVLQVGDIWLHGRRVACQAADSEVFREVNIGHSSVKFVKAGLPEDDQYLLPFENHPWHRNHTESYGVLVALPNNQRLLVPCWELIRFYFGSSSALLGKLFTGPLTSSVLWKEKKFDLERRHSHLVLTGGLTGISAADIGRLAEDGVAWHSAAQIYISCLTAKVKGGAVYPRTGFPFDGLSTLAATGKWLPFGGVPNSTFVVSSLISCSHPFPFESLSYEIDSTCNVPLKMTNKNSTNAAKRTIRNNSNKATNTLMDCDPGEKKTSKLIWIQEKSRFPDLLHKSIWVDKQEVTEVTDTYVRAKDGSLSKISCGTPTGSQEPRCVDLVSAESQEDIDESQGKLPRFVQLGLQILNGKFSKASRVTFELLSPVDGNAIFSLPMIVDEDGVIEGMSVTFRPNGRPRPKRACFAAKCSSGNAVAKFVIVEGGDSFTGPTCFECDESEAFSVWMALEKRVNSQP